MDKRSCEIEKKGELEELVMEVLPQGSAGGK